MLTKRLISNSISLPELYLRFGTLNLRPPEPPIASRKGSDCLPPFLQYYKYYLIPESIAEDRTREA